MKRAVTMKDVARRAEVSVMTVSRVINHDVNVSRQTREKVMEAVEALRYNLNISARSLSSSRSYLIGLLHGNPFSYYFNELLIGSLKQCRESGYHLMIESCGADPRQADSDLPGRLRHSNLDGLIVPERVSNYPPVLQALEDLSIPHVRISSEPRPGRSPNVCIDNRRAVADMTGYLLSLGHRNIGFIKGDWHEHVSKQRYRGYREALQARGLEYEADNVEQGDFTFESGMEAAMKLLSRPRRPTAIFASNDYMASGVLSAARELDIRVPQELSIAGFDDIFLTTMTRPALTTVSQHVSELAATAVELLIRIINEPEILEDRDPLTMTLNHKLTVRGSTAPPQ